MNNKTLRYQNAIKRNIQNKVELINNQVKLDLEKFLNSAIENIDEYEDEDLNGKQIKRNTSAIADKIEYLIDELPEDHPLRKSGNIQKLITKLDAISQKPDSEVTYDVMIAGGKPPKVSKQRFWSPIANLLNQARADVLKPSAYIQDTPSVDLPAQHLDVRQGLIVKNKPAPSVSIPKKDPKQLVRGRVSNRENSADSKQQVSQEILHESGAKPGYIFDSINSISRDRYEKMSQLNNIMQKASNALNQLGAIGHSIKDTSTKETLEIHKILDDIHKETRDTDNGYSEIYYINKSVDIESRYKSVYQYLEKIEPFTNILDDVIDDISSRNNSQFEYKYNWINPVSNLINAYDKAIKSYGDEIDNIETKLPSNVELTFAVDVDNFFKVLKDTNFQNITNEISHIKEISERISVIYSQLMHIDKDKHIYNDFMEILKDGSSKQDIKKAIDQYIVNRVSK